MLRCGWLSQCALVGRDQLDDKRAWERTAAYFHSYTLKARAAAQDTTPYLRHGERDYLQYWTQRLSAAIVTADARRCLRRLKSLQALANRAAAKQTNGPPPAGSQTPSAPTIPR